MGAVDGEDGVAGVLGEGVAAVGRVRDLLCLLLCGVERVDGHDAVGLVGEEAGGVVDVDDRAAGEDPFTLCAGEDGDRLVHPVVEVFGGGMAPMLVARYDAGGVVWWHMLGLARSEVLRVFTLVVQVVSATGI